MISRPHAPVLRGALPAMAGYVAVRLLGILALWAALDFSGGELWHSLTARYDAGLLLGIADGGYDDGAHVPSNLAFFPVFPLLVRGLGAVIGIPAAGVLISAAAGVATAAALYAIGRRLGQERMGTVLAILWGALPHAITQSMAYTETAFTALAAWSLFAVLGREWLAAGILACVAGATRPTGVALIAVVGIAAIVDLIRCRGRAWRAWVGGAVAPLGFLAYVGWVASRTGGIDGWFLVQAGWGSRFDGGRYTATTFIELLNGQTSLQLLVVSAVIAGAVTLLLVSATERVRWELQLFSLFVVVLGLATAGYYQSKARLILPAFTLLIPVAMALSAARRATCAVVLAVLAAGSAWFGAYLLVHAPYSP